MPQDQVEQSSQGQHLLGSEPTPDLRTRLLRLQPLNSRMPPSYLVPCKICGADSAPFDRVDFNKYCSAENYYEFGFSGVIVDYLRCTNCGFLFTTFCDSWGPGDFRDLIYNDDYIKVDGEYAEARPAHTASVIAKRFRGAEGARILDYGSGSGVFVRLMRNTGFTRTEEFDPFSSPARPEGRFDIITCFEVIEHSPDPRNALADMVSCLQPDGCILLSQTLQPDNMLSIRGNWWYLAPRNGHLSTFTEEALELLGREHGFLFYRGDTVYGFAGPSPSRFAQVALASIGPSFSTLRLFAPATLPNITIVSPDRNRVVWHRTETLGARHVRWTGSYRRLQWRAKWSPVMRMRIHIPMLQEVVPGFAGGCKLSLDGVEAPVMLIRGELAAEFDVHGKISGDIQLLTPEPISVATAAGRALGVAIPVERRSRNIPR
jgi:SAM-dependent methyltransferase